MITVRKTPNADTRTATGEITKELLESESRKHIEDVGKGMDWIANEISLTGKEHDWTKMDYLDMFYEDVCTVQNNPNIEFTGLPWDRLHCNKERHHLNDTVPVDVNLIDVIELVVDCVMAGLARSGEVRKDFFNIPNEVLQEAVWNTAKLLEKQCIVGD